MKNLLIVIVLSSLCGFCFATEPANLGLLQKEEIRYHDSGQYAKDMAKQIQTAETYLKRRVAENKRHHAQEKLAIVLDIDETALSNYADMKRLNFGGTHEEIDASEGAGHDPAINPTLRLYRYARANDVAVFFITGRHEKYREATVKNLHEAGYHDWAQLIMEANDLHPQSASDYKSMARKKIIDDGYDIALNIGDQNSDLKGEFTDKGVKLPNPFYYIP